MKKNIIFLLAALIFAAACSDKQHEVSKLGYLSFEGWELSVDEEVQTKSVVPASGNYTIIIEDKAAAIEPIKTDYKSIKEAGNKISLPEGEYNVIARSTEEEVPGAAFEQPVYGVQKEVSIKSGESTQIGEMICRLLQVKVTVDYSEEFLAMVTGPCTATVSVNPSYPLVYNINYIAGKPTYDHSAGYFAVNNGTKTTLEVVFKGNVDGGVKTMTQTFDNIKACTWHQLKFVKKAAEEGSADIEIVIEDYVEDVDLGNNIAGNETIIGDDPDAPKGDGGIKLESTCTYDITKPIVVPALGDPFILTMKATVPNAVLKFTVDISSTNSDFVDSVKMINDGSSTLDLVNPSEGAISVFTTILPFPYGDQVAGKTEINFDLSDAQAPILGFKGTHTFTMNVMDKLGCKKSINVEMQVN